VAVGDFNGDGIPDLAVANYGGANVTVLLGNATNFTGAFGFTAAVGSPFAVGNGPYSMVVGDLNGDSIPDLAVANFTDGNVSVLLGNATNFTGAFGFAPATGTFQVGPTSASEPQSLALADFNGDGKLDIASANFGVNSVTVLLGGSAATSPSLSTTAPSSIAAGTPVPLTLTVSDIGPALDAPTGTVTILDNGSPIGTSSQTASPYTFNASSLGVGVHPLTASYGGDTRSAGSTSNSISIAVLGAQTITFGALSNQTLGATPGPLSATASSGLPVMFTSNTTAVCTASGTNGVSLTLVTTGTCSITASQPGDAMYAAAAPVTWSFTITISQTLQFDTIPNQLFGRSPFVVAAQASSLLPVTFTSTTPAVCTTKDDMVTFLIAGPCSITANQPGNATFAAVSITKSFTVSQANPSGTLAPATGSPITAGSNPASVAVGDFNEDGIPDLAVADNSGGGTVLFGTGLGGGEVQ